jgi:hydrogenase maturation protein HypF
VITGRRIRVQGIVQGVGFRPAVWCLADQLRLTGTVLNDGDGVVIELWGDASILDRFVKELARHCPPRARIDSLQQAVLEGKPAATLRILLSQHSVGRVIIPTDTAICADCLAELHDPGNRRYRYPFICCSHCGPRFSVIASLPYDRCNTSMATFHQCPLCQSEYDDPANRRFHAQTNACSDCGPRVWMEPDAGPVCGRDDIERCGFLIKQGAIIALKGIGGFHLVCDASNEQAVMRLRQRKGRYAKPFALMARDIEVIRQYCQLHDDEISVLTSAAAPIVLLQRNERDGLAAAVAPKQKNLGFMLPYTPLHSLLLHDFDFPLVMTSGNFSEYPPCIDNNAAREQLKGIADYWLLHDRDILHRIDDSVVQLVNRKPRVIRLARGYAPITMPLPPGFSKPQNCLALGGELKNTVCLVRQGQAIVSAFIGDLENQQTLQDYENNLDWFRHLYKHQTELLAIDLHPEYLSSKLGREWAANGALKLVEIQHHHAHVARCLAENNWPIDGEKVLGIVLDGLGFGSDGRLWGGEFLLADYQSFERLACLKPVPLIGGARAMLEPWRNTYAHLLASWGNDDFLQTHAHLQLVAFLRQQPLKTFNAMLSKPLNTPLASSCGRLFDAVAAAVGVCRQRNHYEGQAAIELEALIDEATLKAESGQAYDFTINRAKEHIPWLDPTQMWQSLVADLKTKTPACVISARFHLGFVNALASMVEYLSGQVLQRPAQTIVLSGGVFQNSILLTRLTQLLEKKGFEVLSHSKIPSNDSGLALGQAVVALAQSQ